MAKNDSFEEPALEDGALLTAAEIAKIKEEARKEILSAKKADLKRKILADETRRLRNEEGLTTGNAHSDEIVSITIDLPIFSPHILINGQAYWHGHTYSIPRHVADTLRSQMFCSWQHQSTIEGRSKQEFYAQKHVQDLYKPGTTGSVLSGKAS